MTTAARRHSKRRQSGQSMLEFAILVPLIIGMMTMLVQVEMAISASIVGQRYARQHLHFLFFNHRQYPEHAFLNMKDGSFMERYWVGVDKHVNDAANGDINPVTPSYKIGRKKAPEDDADGAEFSTRQNVRLRAAAFICVPPQGVNSTALYSEDNMQEDTFAAGNFHYCFH